MTLEYTVPFFLKNDSNEEHLNIDKVNVSNQNKIDRNLFSLIRSKISLDDYGNTIPSEVAKELIDNQYKVCLNYIYSNSIWEKLRTNNAIEILLGYIIETRHYLLAASSRMSSGLAYSWHTTPMSFILTEHLIEEADHAVFFENALINLGCNINIIKSLKPSPITYEWIFLMRSISSRNPIVSAVCSGLMESSARDRNAVKGWHKLLIEKEILRPKTVEKFYEHVELDIKLGHGSCWEEVLMSNSFITSELLKEALNSITIVAEMLDRWFTSLEYGLSGITIQLAGKINQNKKGKNTPTVDSYFNGNPVFSSTVLHQVSHERNVLNDAVSKIIGYKYFVQSPAISKSSEIQNIINSANSINLKELSVNISEFKKQKPLINSIKDWLISVDGHLLWNEMLENPSENLAFGFILENYHYINSSIAHTSAVIYSCPIEDLRNDFIKHLHEEENHGEILLKSLRSFENDFFKIENLRPLPTTLAFIGF
ncbi:MAG TPA: hypothetical protein VFN30_09665, partial [Chitinophagaceae bacterium]|nr:hypothetical protein [Chitinophagaceae bacterium]